MSFKINNRRYTGSKYKICDWIHELIMENCNNCNSFCDIFAGTGVVTNAMLDEFNEFIINDFLYSNELIYNAFYSKDDYDEVLLYKFYRKYKNIDVKNITPNYVSKNFGNKYFSEEDSLKIGFIREDLENEKCNMNHREFCILLTSLIYSFDRCANTVGHYEAFFQGKTIKSGFNFELISPIILPTSSKKISIYRKDANILSTEITADITYIDPPYSSRQYSRFYHVIETIVKWDKPKLYGVAMKPEPENMSEYCNSKAVDAFHELIVNLKSKYIVVSYNNTYNSKSKSSENKMTLDEILDILNKKGKTTIYDKEYMAFNAGKTDLKEHKEYVFITEVGVF